MYQALYRAYRPETFSQVLGQEHIVRILKNQIDTDSTSHAYLFCGTRGTGKTTTARLLAKGLNCLAENGRPCGECANCRAIKEGSFIDVVEIDAASNNGVENIRELRESVNYPPALGRRKIYIIDEVHMLSTGAFNALLKTLEEPPEYVTFILATTEVHKLPATILSRCMRLDFRRVPENTLVRGMGDICRHMGIHVSEDALRIIAANADGSVRDGLSILDQCISGGQKEIETKDVLEFLGASGDEDFLELTDMVRKKRTSQAIEFLAGILSDGKDVRQFIRDWINHYRNLLMVKFVKNPQTVVSMSEENIGRISRQAAVLELEDINRGILELSRTAADARWSTQPRILLELSIVRLCLGAGEIRELTECELPGNVAAKASPACAGAKAAQPAQAKAAQPPQAEAASNEASCPAEGMPLQTEHPESAGKADAPGSEEAPDKVNPAETGTQAQDDEAEEFDCEEIWNRVFEDGEKEKGSFFLVRQGGTLTSIDERFFTVAASSSVAESHMENNRRLIEDLMEKHTGSRRIMKISSKNMKEAAKKSPEEIAENVSEILGIHVEVE